MILACNRTRLSEVGLTLGKLMALGDTIYVFDIELANSDSNIYESLNLRVARHPSETAERMLTRVLAYCLEYTEGIALTNGISEPDAPAIAIRDLTGALRVWIDVGAPEAARLHRASKAAQRVAVYTHKDAAQLAARLAGERIHRLDALELYAMDFEWLSSLAERLQRRTTFTLTVSEQHLYLSLGEETLSGVIKRIPIQ
jgi:uncharacterized protein YaeQ